MKELMRVKGKTVRRFYRLCQWVLVFFASRRPVKKRVIAESFLGKRHDDNISLYLAQLDTNVTPIYYVQGRDNKLAVPHGERLVKYGIRYIWFMHTSSLIITNSRLHESMLVKRPEQKVLQFWHGIPWKRLVHDQAVLNFTGQTNTEYLATFKRDVALWDYLWVPNAYAKARLSSAFTYEGEYIEAMYPADKDLLQRQADFAAIARIKQAIGLTSDKRVILYMPTFREYETLKHGVHAYYPSIDIAQVARNNPGCIILTRVHYLSADIPLATVPNVIDVSEYESVNELYLVSDILLTDYSSAIYSFALLRKPIISLQFDCAIYESRRGLYDDGIDGMDIIIVKNAAEFAALNLQTHLRPSRPQGDYYK
jgi:CDP-glycerol glycerophosphotransferase